MVWEGESAPAPIPGAETPVTRGISGGKVDQLDRGDAREDLPAVAESAVNHFDSSAEGGAEMVGGCRVVGNNRSEHFACH